MKEKQISIRLTTAVADQIEKKSLFYKISKSEYIARCISENFHPLDRQAMAKGLCMMTTELNLLDLECEENQHIKNIRSEMHQLWQCLK